MLETVREMQSSSIEQLKTAQEQVVSFNERIADTMLSAMPNFQSPFAEYLPSPKELIESHYTYTTELQSARAEFALAVARAWDRSGNEESDG